MKTDPMNRPADRNSSAPKKIVLAEYFTDIDQTLLFAARADWEAPLCEKIPLPLSELRAYVAAHFSPADGDESASPGLSRSQVPDLDLGEWQAQMGKLVAPLAQWTDEGDIIYLVPHDVLHYLPLHALQIESDYLIKRNPVVYTASASVLKYCQAKRKGRRQVALVLGDSDENLPLPNAREEASQVASLFGGQAYLGEQALKSVLTQKLSQEGQEIDILHLACHGYFHPEQALKSGILLAPESDADEPAEMRGSLLGLPIQRFLTAEEIFGLDMAVDLVTLSACESGVNELQPGDELFGLMRALIYAGTPSVVISLWGVEDISTELLMVHFYERLKSGDNKVEALQSAQLFIQDLTAEQAEAYFEAKLAQISAHEPERRAQTEASIRSIYQKLLAAEDWEGRPVGMDYRPFAHPFYWAPFILVGDWQ